VVKDKCIDADKLVAEAVEWARKPNDNKTSEGYGDSVAQLRRSTQNLSIDRIDAEIKNQKRKKSINNN
jgi:hypothetical protein